MRRSRRNRVLDDRLWDDAEQEWCRVRGEWADVREVERRLADGHRVVLHGLHRPVRWLTPAEAAEHWRRIRPHFQVPGQDGAESDAEGLTHAAVVWRRGDRKLLGFEAFC